MSKFISEEMKCQLCRGRFNKERKRPLMLSRCGHTFCAECIYADANEGRFFCPQDEIAYDVAGPVKFPTNHIVLKLISRAEESTPCGLHDRPRDYFCTRDKIEVCADCLLSGEHRGHDSLPVSQMPRYFAELHTQLKNSLDGFLFSKDFEIHETLVDLLDSKFGARFEAVRGQIEEQFNELRQLLKQRVFEKFQAMQAECLSSICRKFTSTNSETNYTSFRRRYLEVRGVLRDAEAIIKKGGALSAANLAPLAKIDERMADCQRLYQELKSPFEAIDKLNVRLDFDVEVMDRGIFLRQVSRSPRRLENGFEMINELHRQLENEDAKPERLADSHGPSLATKHKHLKAAAVSSSQVFPPKRNAPE